jgi:hypothetical protein
MPKTFREFVLAASEILLFVFLITTLNFIGFILWFFIPIATLVDWVIFRTNPLAAPQVQRQTNPPAAPQVHQTELPELPPRLAQLRELQHDPASPLFRKERKRQGSSPLRT